MTFDFKKAYREFYLPGRTPEIVMIPQMRFVTVEGVGNPNEPDGDYARALAVLYAVAYAVKMSKRGSRPIEGYFDFVVPPLEGFWWMPDGSRADVDHKSDFRWLSAIRLPDFVTRADFDWAISEASRKKGLDCSKARMRIIEEGLCAQILHLGPYDDEPASVARMDAYLAQNGYACDFSDARRHHEIYLSDPRRTAAEKLKTVIRHPVKRIQA